MSEQPTIETPGPRAHDIGRDGLVTVAVEADDIRIRGVEGTEARVVVPADGAGLETRAEPGQFSVRRMHRGGSGTVGFVGLKIGSRGFGFPLGVHVSGTIELEVPRDARVEVRSTAGDIAIRDVRGGTTIKTAAGDVSIKNAAGQVAVDLGSGDVHVTAAAPLTLSVHSISGDVEAIAPRFERVAIETVSGDAELAGAFAGGTVHTVSTVSGDVELSVVGGLVLEVKTVSGDVDCAHPDRRSGDGRRQPLVIGDGAARLTARTMSGDVEVRAGKPWHVTFTRDEEAVGSGVAGSPTRPAPPVAPAQPSDAATLAVLEALARGEIDVVEAERRLAGDRPAGTEAAAEPRPEDPAGAPTATTPEASPDA